MKKKKIAILGLIGAICTMIFAFFTLNQYGVQANEKQEATNEITINQLDDKIYNNEAFIYFYKPDCPYCKKANNDIFKAAKDANVELYQIDLSKKENKRLWQDYNIGGTPTIIHFNKGEEFERIEGAVQYKAFRNFFEIKN
ncbi:thiol reductase thioredoxin [Bacillus cereus]|nr:thiol reductase thioredoxin [Bacillus cereus]